MYRRVIEASNGQFPARCPIPAGIYRIDNLRIDLDKYPMLMRSFSANANIIFHKNGRILAKFHLKGGIKL